MLASPVANSNGVAGIDNTDNSIFTTVPILAPTGVAVLPDGSMIYVPNRQNGNYSVLVIDASTYDIRTTIALDASPNGIAITPL